MAQAASQAERTIREHIEAFWPNHRKEYFSWELGPISRTLPRFRVCRISPRAASEPWIYLTVGAWEVPKKERQEFFLLSPVEEALHVEILAMLAHFYADEKYDMHLGKAVDIGRPWLDKSPCDHLLVSLPYPFGKKLEFCRVDEKLTVRFLWLLPIYKAEAELLKAKGLEALERRFDEVPIDYLDIHRPSVVSH